MSATTQLRPNTETTLYDFGIVSARTTELQTEPPTYLHHNDPPKTEKKTIASTPDPPVDEPIYLSNNLPTPTTKVELYVFEDTTPHDPVWTPTPEPSRSCHLCGSAVGPSFARINRDADGLIRGCPHCDQHDVSRTDRWGTWDAIGEGELFADGGKDGIAYDTKPIRERQTPTYGETACCLTCGEEHDAEKIGCHLVEIHPEQANRIIEANA